MKNTGIFSKEAKQLFSRINELYSEGLIEEQMYQGNHQSLIMEWDDTRLGDTTVLTVQEFLRDVNGKKTPGDE